jgi:hypothetical protein
LPIFIGMRTVGISIADITMHRPVVSADGSAAYRRLQALREQYGEVVRTHMEDNNMKRFTMMAAALLLVSACSESPIAGPSAESSDAGGTMSLTVGPSVGLILNPGTTNELPALVSNAWKEQAAIDVQQLIQVAAAQIEQHNPEHIEVTESWLSEVMFSRVDPDELVDTDFVSLLQKELDTMGMDFRVMQTETPISRVIPMLLRDGTTQDMRLTVKETILIQDSWIP